MIVLELKDALFTLIGKNVKPRLTGVNPIKRQVVILICETDVIVNVADAEMLADTLDFSDLVNHNGKYLQLNKLDTDRYQIVNMSTDDIVVPAVNEEPVETSSQPVTASEAKEKNAGSPNAVRGCPFKNKSFV